MKPSFPLLPFNAVFGSVAFTASMFLSVSLLPTFPLLGISATLTADELVKSNEASNVASKPAQTGFLHPGISHSQASIDFVKSKVEAGEQPWLNSWKRLNDSSYSSLRWEPRPLDHVERGASNRPDIGSGDFSRDATASYTHALHWAISGDERHARKSAEIINAWSQTLESISNHDAKLLVGMEGHKFCNAAELLRHTWDGWPDKDQQRFRKMATDIWYPIIEDFYPSANGNWDASMLQTMIAMGVFMDDRKMFDRAVSYFLEGEGNGAVRNYFNEFGECQESGRDQAHTQMGLEFLANTCETAWNQGVDLYSAFDNRLLLGFEYTAKYNLGRDVRYERYISFEKRYDYKSISDNSRGRLRPMYEKVYNHYHNRKGLPAQYTKEAALKIRFDLNRRGSSERRSRRRRSSTRASLPWDTLMYTDQPASFDQDQSETR